MTIGDRIRIRREELGMTQEELAQKVGYKSRSSINKVETDAQQLTQRKLKALADALQTTPAYIMGWTDSTSRRLGAYALYFGEIACGLPKYAQDCPEIIQINDIQPVEADFCLRAKGDSMINARIHDGDLVYIRSQQTVENGEIAAVLIGDEATLKRVYYYPTEYKLVLQAENPAYAPLVYVNEELNDVRIIGKAVAFQSTLVF